MALNGSGPISLGGSTTGQSVNLELGKSATAQISFNDSDVRTLTNTSSSSTLIMPTNFYGKSTKWTYSGTMTQGIDTSGMYPAYGFARGYAGSLSPDDTTIFNVYRFNNGTQWYFSVTLATPVGTPQSYWTTVTIGGSFSINSSAATTFYNGNTWEFAGTNPAPLTGSGTTSLVFS